MLRVAVLTLAVEDKLSFPSVLLCPFTGSVKFENVKCVISPGLSAENFPADEVGGTPAVLATALLLFLTSPFFWPPIKRAKP